MLSKLFLSLMVIGLIGVFVVKFGAQLTEGESNADVNYTVGVVNEAVMDTIDWLPLLALIVVMVVGLAGIAYLKYAGIF